MTDEDKPKPRRYQGVTSNGILITIVTGDKPKTMTTIGADGSMTEMPYEERRSGKLTKNNTLAM
jgi:hypothetical protein